MWLRFPSLKNVARKSNPCICQRLATYLFKKKCVVQVEVKRRFTFLSPAFFSDKVGRNRGFTGKQRVCDGANFFMNVSWHKILLSVLRCFWPSWILSDYKHSTCNLFLDYCRISSNQKVKSFCLPIMSWRSTLSYTCFPSNVATIKYSLLFLAIDIWRRASFRQEVAECIFQYTWLSLEFEFNKNC